MNAEELSDLISQAEAARLRKVTREAIYDLVARGRLKMIEIGGKKFVSRKEILNFEALPSGRPTTGQTKRKSQAKNVD